jgi:hypothetical protein
VFSTNTLGGNIPYPFGIHLPVARGTIGAFHADTGEAVRALSLQGGFEFGWHGEWY